MFGCLRKGHVTPVRYDSVTPCKSDILFSLSVFYDNQ